MMPGLPTHLVKELNVGTVTEGVDEQERINFRIISGKAMNELYRDILKSRVGIG